MNCTMDSALIEGWEVQRVAWAQPQHRKVGQSQGNDESGLDRHEEQRRPPYELQDTIRREPAHPERHAAGEQNVRYSGDQQRAREENGDREP